MPTSQLPTEYDGNDGPGVIVAAIILILFLCVGSAYALLRVLQWLQVIN